MANREWRYNYYYANAVPRPDWEEMYFFGHDIGSGSNINIFINGQLDAGHWTRPCRAAGWYHRTAQKSQTAHCHPNHWNRSTSFGPPQLSSIGSSVNYQGVREEEKKHMKESMDSGMHRASLLSSCIINNCLITLITFRPLCTTFWNVLIGLSCRSTGTDQSSINPSL